MFKTKKRFIKYSTLVTSSRSQNQDFSVFFAPIRSALTDFFAKSVSAADDQR
jgi:hypothetical protein